MTEQTITPGSYLQELITLESREVEKRHNAAGYIAMWPAAVRKVMEKFPNLSAAERATLRDTVELGIQNLSAQTGPSGHRWLYGEWSGKYHSSEEALDSLQ